MGKSEEVFHAEVGYEKKRRHPCGQADDGSAEDQERTSNRAASKPARENISKGSTSRFGGWEEREPFFTGGGRALHPEGRNGVPGFGGFITVATGFGNSRSPVA